MTDDDDTVLDNASVTSQDGGMSSQIICSAAKVTDHAKTFCQNSLKNDSK